MRKDSTTNRCHVVADVNVAIITVLYYEHLAVDAAGLLDADLQCESVRMRCSQLSRKQNLKTLV